MNSAAIASWQMHPIIMRAFEIGEKFKNIDGLRRKEITPITSIANVYITRLTRRMTVTTEPGILSRIINSALAGCPPDAEGVIDEKYIDLIDNMSVDERNELINDIISVHYDNTNDKKQKKNIIKVTLITIICFFILLFLAPLTLWLINYSFTTTQNNYTEMQNNFEVLYQNKKK